MKWFEGSIPDAISHAKSTESLIIVYITGVDDISKNMDKTWEDEAVSERCEKQCVGLKLQANSEGSAQFCQIYPVLTVPSCYFIGENGVPLEVLAGFLEPKVLLEKLRNVSEMFKSQKTASGASATAQTPPDTTSKQVESPPTTSSANISPPTNDNIVTPPVEAASADAATTPVANSAESPPADDTTEPTQSQASALSKEEKVERAKQLIQQKQAEKALKEKEEAKQREIERRKQGQSVGKLREWQRDREQNDIKEQLRKDKEDARLARERVKAQIARDRAERSEKYAKEKSIKEKEIQERVQARQANEEATSAIDQAKRRETARLQFRLPDGSSVNQNFPSSQPLSTARDFIAEQIQNRIPQFTMATTFPRREFTQGDMSQSLLDLQLAPSAAIVILPGSGNTSVSKSTSTSSWFMILLAPFIAIWTFLTNLLFGAPPSPRGAYNQQQSSPSSEPTTTQQNAYKRPGGGKQSGVSRREGNIHRFSSEDDDEDMSTYNGNSTQQQ
ncbi:unnamed protein product [Owenia fusiformis]|uniref:UBX domain-containing protein 4 n=1 Tax=Owenia fusiformis TaxID=6347 RepID=A0A8J1UE31_OWEFU|nr:unnamed protein product [Owenia fusiformis]